MFAEPNTEPVFAEFDDCTVDERPRTDWKPGAVLPKAFDAEPNTEPELCTEDERPKNVPREWRPKVDGIFKEPHAMFDPNGAELGNGEGLLFDDGGSGLANTPEDELAEGSVDDGLLSPSHC